MVNKLRGFIFILPMFSLVLAALIKMIIQSMQGKLKWKHGAILSTVIILFIIGVIFLMS